MSIISTLYDALVTKVAATWTSAKQIPNALDIESAPSPLLQDGFAIAIGPAVAVPGDQSCQERFDRQVLIMRTLVAPTEHDLTKVTALTKTILEDSFLIRKALRLDNTLGGVISDLAFNSDGGIEQVNTINTAGRFWLVSTAFTVTYLENLYS